MTLNELKDKDLAPEWMTEEGYTMISNGYLQPGETPRDAYLRVAQTIGSKINIPTNVFFDLMWRNWLCPSSPVLSNTGTKNLPIACLIGDTWINTRNGAKQIKNLEIGDLVLTHKGNWKRVTNKQSRPSNNDIYKLQVVSRATPMFITGNHPVLTNYGWVRVDELDAKKHLIAVNEIIENEKNEISFIFDFSKVNLSEWQDFNGKMTRFLKNAKLNTKNIDRNAIQIPTKVELDVELAWALGLWFAEGSVTIDGNKIENGIRVTLGSDEQHFADKFLDILRRKFNVNGTSRLSKYEDKNGKKGSWITVDVPSKVLGISFTQLFGRGCKNKNIPPVFLDLNKTVLTSFLQGVCDGDGHLNRNGIMAVALANPSLLMSLYHIALKLNLPVTLHMQRKAGKYATTPFVYYLSIVDWGRETKGKYNRYNRGTFFEGNRYCYIKTLELTNKNEEVYDITVEDDHSFSVCGVVVHNCYASYFPDDTFDIGSKLTEQIMLTKFGGGCGASFGDIRPKGSRIARGGTTDGVVPFLKMLEAAIDGTRQGSTRRGSVAAYLPIEHGDAEEFVDIRKPTGDLSRKCLSVSFHNALTITDETMNLIKEGNPKYRNLWNKLLTNRVETGEPYVLFKDNANKNCLNTYKNRIVSSNLCSEIFAPISKDETFVCCLSSLNLTKYREWENWVCPITKLSLVELSIYFLDGVISLFIEQTSDTQAFPGLEAARNFAINHRMLGLGVLGWHTLLQQENIAFGSFSAMMLNSEIFKRIRDLADKATLTLGSLYGECKETVGTGRRNTATIAIAPTMSNSVLSGGVSQGIEPITANLFVQKGAKGSFIKRNFLVESLLEREGLNTIETWEQINKDMGSLRNIKGLSQEDKEIFLTAREIDQFALVQQAAQRQKFIDQGQSLNLFFTTPKSKQDSLKVAKYINEVHLTAWELGVKSLYYLKTGSPIKGQALFIDKESSCVACEG